MHLHRQLNCYEHYVLTVIGKPFIMLLFFCSA